MDTRAGPPVVAFGAGGTYNRLWTQRPSTVNDSCNRVRALANHRVTALDIQHLSSKQIGGRPLTGGIDDAVERGDHPGDRWHDVQRPIASVETSQRRNADAVGRLVSDTASCPTIEV